MDDISQENDPSSQPDGSQDTPTDSMSSRGARAIYEREARIEIDYSQLEDEYKEVYKSYSLMSLGLGLGILYVYMNWQK